MYKLYKMLQAVLIILIVFTFSAVAKNLVKTITVYGMRIELHILPAEPFFTSDEVASKNVKEGMLIINGAEPVSIGADIHPNHHLVIHIYDAKTGKAITDAIVTMNFQKLDVKGKPAGKAVEVPIVKMQSIGKGIGSTHYGNNVVMSAGSYNIAVIVNRKSVNFIVKLSSAVNVPTEKMHMH